MATKKQYVDDVAFLAALKNYLPIVKPLRDKHDAMCEKLREKGVKKKNFPSFVRPQTPDYDFIGTCILKIAEHLSYHPFYNKHSFREEMVGDAIENAIRYMENFDPEIGVKPFAYFTQIMTFAFWRRIEREKKNSVIKQMSIEGSSEGHYHVQDGDTRGYSNTYVAFLKEVKSDMVSEYKEKLRVKKEKAAATKKGKGKKREEKPGVERFMVPKLEFPDHAIIPTKEVMFD